MEGTNKFLVRVQDAVVKAADGKKESAVWATFCPDGMEKSRRPLTRENAINLAVWLLAGVDASEAEIATMMYMVKLQRSLEKIA